jgi:spore cortex formation protein SpoVR/YcgB (stage V sporulation)
MRRRKPISTGSDWTFSLLERYDRELSRLANGKYGLDTYPNQIEVIRSEQMLDALSAIGMPVGYHHWSFGKQFMAAEARYERGEMGLAYEMVINSNPCISYLMEGNTMTMQALVIAHACYGHNSFFKGNYLFRSWTDASAIIDYLVFARGFIAECEQRHGIEAVERTLDSCHALMNYGVDRYRHSPKLSAAAERAKQQDREAYLQRTLNELWRTLPIGGQPTCKDKVEGQVRFPPEPEENILYFIEKKAPLLEPWQREIVRIVRKLAQYFHPQPQTKVMNEGWATFWHYTLLHDLYDEGLVTDGFMLEFLESHSGVIMQPGFDHPWYSGINPYRLGLAMFQDIRRICEAPTDEDRAWFPDIAGAPWRATLETAMRDYKDESFIQQFLSPKVIRDLRLFCVRDDDTEDAVEIEAIHDDAGYRRVRERLALQHNYAEREPNIQVQSVDIRGDRTLTLRHTRNMRRPLSGSTSDVLKHVHRLWSFPVKLECVEGDATVAELRCPPPATKAGVAA